MKTGSLLNSRIAKGLVLLFAGGSMFTTCQGRFRQAVVDGGKTLLFQTLFDPTPIIDLLVPTTDDSATTSNN
ncbi:MAG: hypothetical protein ACE5E5_07780 [Phycisphaerae bacterium]